MRRVLALLLVSAALASQAGAAPKPVAQPRPAASAVTETQSVLPPLIPLAQARGGGDASQCRASCARTYYFCKAGTEDDSCPGQFGQCNARCTATYRRPGT
ncbi:MULTISPECIES: hypothetical protein [unclassified Caulobacter]|uniref:hypothetical protein n=1 Tax=unclassified Caulobacter TaxID=2648921 RepID=UPI000D3A7294|nr:MULTISPECIES: hypothetical protein [unclassified Caulobacter]PTS86812.1 hypothetical protein DBR21_14155 [Caulobacter sp. HMWF009]PTT11638.1 hypothetical protein DBR10_03125 [Caulobacter sp. HMWF025]